MALTESLKKEWAWTASDGRLTNKRVTTHGMVERAAREVHGYIITVAYASETRDELTPASSHPRLPCMVPHAGITRPRFHVRMKGRDARESVCEREREREIR